MIWGGFIWIFTMKEDWVFAVHHHYHVYGKTFPFNLCRRQRQMSLWEFWSSIGKHESRTISSTPSTKMSLKRWWSLQMWFNSFSLVFLVHIRCHRFSCGEDKGETFLITRNRKHAFSEKETWGKERHPQDIITQYGSCCNSRQEEGRGDRHP